MKIQLSSCLAAINLASEQEIKFRAEFNVIYYSRSLFKTNAMSGEQVYFDFEV